MRPLIVRGGLVFDGLGAPGRELEVLVKDGAVAGLLPPGTPVGEEAMAIDARGCRVTPGFIDVHTHYGAEIELRPGLGESVRHGVTTVFLGSCGLSMAIGEPDDLADMFCRVEGIPGACVAPLLKEILDWRGPAEYLAHLEQLPLGPNVAALLGHSAIRAAAMGVQAAAPRAMERSAARAGVSP